jgi:hypothetical protein
VRLRPRLRTGWHHDAGVRSHVYLSYRHFEAEAAALVRCPGRPWEHECPLVRIGVTRLDRNAGNRILLGEVAQLLPKGAAAAVRHAAPQPTRSQHSAHTHTHTHTAGRVWARAGRRGRGPTPRALAMRRAAIVSEANDRSAHDGVAIEWIF